MKVKMETTVNLGNYENHKFSIEVSEEDLFNGYLVNDPDEVCRELSKFAWKKIRHFEQIHGKN